LNEAGCPKSDKAENARGPALTYEPQQKNAARIAVTQSTLSAGLAGEHHPMAKIISEALEVAKRQKCK